VGRRDVQGLITYAPPVNVRGVMGYGLVVSDFRRRRGITERSYLMRGSRVLRSLRVVIQRWATFYDLRIIYSTIIDMKLGKKVNRYKLIYIHSYCIQLNN